MEGPYKLVPAKQAGFGTLAGSAGRSLYSPFHVLFSRISNKMYLESLRYILSHCPVSFAVPFNFIRFQISALCLNNIILLGEMKGAGGAGGGERFGPIVQGLLVGNEQLRTNCMTLINAIISSPEDLDFRIHLRNEFLRVGLVDVLEVSISTSKKV